MPTLIKQIDIYLNHLATEKRYSARTVAGYRHDLSLWLNFMMQRVQSAGSGPEVSSKPIDNFFLDQVTLEDLRTYLDYLEKDRANKPGTQARKLAALRSLFAFAEQEGWLTTINPARRLATPKLPQRKPVYFTAAECRDLLDKVQNGSGRNKLRDRAIITLFLHAGLRLSELVNLDLEDLDLEEGTVRVLGKGNKERVIPLSQEAQRVLNAYLEVRPPTDEPALFLSHFKRRMTTNAVQWMLKVQTGNLDLSPHKLRHSCATLLHSADVSLVELQRLLGHASIATTQIYTHTNMKRLREAVQRHPLETDNNV